MELQSELEKLRDPEWEPFMGCRAHATKYDAAYAHALVRAMADGDDASGRDLSWWLKHRAESYMREWGFEEKVTP